MKTPTTKILFPELKVVFNQFLDMHSYAKWAYLCVTPNCRKKLGNTQKEQTSEILIKAFVLNELEKQED